LYAESIKDKYGFKIKYFTTSNAMWNDVKSGNGAATFDDGPVLQYGIRNGMPLKIVTKQINATPIAIGFKKGQNKELQAKINDGIKWMQKTGRMQKLIDKYTKGSGTKTESSKDRTIFGLIKNNRKALLTGLWETIELTIIGSLCALAFGLVLGDHGHRGRQVLEGSFQHDHLHLPWDSNDGFGILHLHWAAKPDWSKDSAVYGWGLDLDA
jgi:polar amino acid transport system substrate-binding protein